MLSNQGTDELIVREMRAEDYDDLILLWQEAGLPCRLEGRDSRENLVAQMGEACSLYLVALLNGRMIASVLCTHDGRKGWINRLAVAPDFQRQGMAALMVREAERRFKEMGLEVFAALIEEWNEKSRELFKNLGYEHDPHVMYFSKRKSPGS